MAQVSPFHTITPEASKTPDHRDVFHCHTDCREGRRIVAWQKVFGTGGRPRCEVCESLGVKRR
jgi:hypothetical protein